MDELIFWQGFSFDEQSFKVFKEEFKPSEIPNYYECPNCKSKEIHYYNDCFMCFDCKFKEKILNSDFILTIINNYLCRQNKITKEIQYFHRFLMKEEIELTSKQRRIPTAILEVHHRNQIKQDNRKLNLQVLTKGEHESLHEDNREYKAFETWSEKTGSDCYEDFSKWLDKKNGVMY